MNRINRFLENALRTASLAVCLFAFSVYAGQDNIRFETIGLEQGLSQQNVRAIHQDSEGFMWFGTQEGLNRFDGYQFKVFSNSLYDTNTISSSYVSSIDETSDGKLWLATGAGVSVFDKTTHSFKRYNTFLDGKGGKVIDALVVYVDSADNVWVGTSNGLNKYDPVNDSFEYVMLGGIKNDKPIRIESIVEDITNGIWIGVQNHGIYRYDTLTKRFELFNDIFEGVNDKVTSSIVKLLVDGEQRLWIGTLGQGVFVLDLKLPKHPSNTNHLTKVEGLDAVSVRAFYQDVNKTIWIGTNSGLYAYDKNKQFIEVLRYDITNAKSISDNTISSICLGWDPRRP